MIKKDMINYFGITRKTFDNWENDKTSLRYVLYKTLEALPVEYVENIKKQIDDAEKNNKLLE